MRNWGEKKLFHSEISDTVSINLHFSRNSSSDHITDIPHAQSLFSLCSWLGIFRSEVWGRKKLKGGSCGGCFKWKEWRESCGWNQIFCMIPAYVAWIPKGPWANLMSFHYAALRYKFEKAKDWKHSTRIIKGSPKITGKCCTYWQQHSPVKADRKQSPKLDEKNKFCTFVKVFPPTLSLLFCQNNKRSVVVLTLSSLK